MQDVLDWVTHLISHYWFLVFLNSLLSLAVLTSIGVFAWIPKFVGATILWSLIWVLIVSVRDVFVSEQLGWSLQNYPMELVWEASQAIWYAIPRLWDVGKFLEALWAWPGFRPPTQSVDLGHLVAVLVSTLLWDREKQFKEGFASGMTTVTDDPAPDVPNSEAVARPDHESNSGPFDYRSFVDSDSVRSLAVRIASEHLEGPTDTLMRAAALFEYVKNHVTYVSDPIHRGQNVEYNATPVETLENGGGDCDDQAVLMASLLSAIGIENRMLLVGNDRDEWHLATEFRIDASMRDVFADVLNGFYANVDRAVNSGNYLSFEEDGGLWLLADTTRDFVGEYGSLWDQGFLYQTDSGFQWTHCAGVY